VTYAMSGGTLNPTHSLTDTLHYQIIFLKFAAKKAIFHKSKTANSVSFVKFCQKSILALRPPSFRHFVSFSSKTKSFGAYPSLINRPFNKLINETQFLSKHSSTNMHSAFRFVFSFSPAYYFFRLDFLFTLLQFFCGQNFRHRRTECLR